MNHGLIRPLPAAGAALAALAGLMLAVGPSRADTVAPPAGLPTFALPAPTGPYPVGTVDVHLLDRGRRDPFVAARPHRELMVQIWYPARDGGWPAAPWLSAGAAARFEAANGLPAGLMGLITTHGRPGAGVAAHRAGFPVILFSPGSGNMRSEYTALLEDLASNGYVVVGIDATHDSAYVEFPDGRVEAREQPADGSGARQAIDVRVADAAFVLDRLRALNAGHRIDVERRPMPTGLAGALDLDRVGMFGHSLGGDVAARMTAQHRLVRVGADVDGSIHDPVPVVRRPFLLISHLSSPEQDPTMHEALWNNLRGWRLDLRLTGSGHLSFTDYAALAPQVAQHVDLPEGLLRSLGTIDGPRSVAIQRAYLLALFDRHLRHRGHLLDGPSAAYPEMVFQRA